MSVRSETCTRNDIHEDLDLSIHLHSQGFQITYQASVKVGVAVRRVFSNRGELWENLILWPETLKSHGKKTWIFGWIGAAILYVLSPVPIFNEWLARLLGREAIEEY
jgi:hypothetical protein